MNKKSWFSICFSTLISLFLSVPMTHACSRVLKSDDQLAVMVGRNMDWYDKSMASDMLILPRGIKHRGFVQDNPLKWTSKYGSIVAQSYHKYVSDGMNEKGLAVHGLSLDSDYGVRDASRPGISVIQWVQFYIDQFATVKEVVEFTRDEQNIQLVTFFFEPSNKYVGIHIAIEDASGDSAIIEYLNGKSIIHHGRQYNTLTNNPSFDKQLQNLHQYMDFGGQKSLPGTALPKDRFVRASYYLKHLPNPANNREKITYLFRVLENVSEPYAINNVTPGVVPTLWSVISDLTNKKYYYRDSKRFNTIWVDLKKFDLSKGQPILKLDISSHEDKPEYNGDVSEYFKMQFTKLNAI
jgi:penicillin V acylase-like amidase (Ntn superfamily)